MRYFVNESWTEMIIEQETQTIIISESGATVDYQSISYPIVMGSDFKEIEEPEATMWKEAILLTLRRNLIRIEEAFSE